MSFEKYLQQLDAVRHSIDPNDLDGSLREKWNARFQKSGEYSFKATQAAILESCELLCEWDGCGALIQSAVGSGKTLVIQLLAAVYSDVESTLVLCPPDLRTEMVNEIIRWRDHFNLGDSKGRMPKVLAYSELSQPGSTEILRHLAPDLIIADEVQNLGNPLSARTKRFLQYMKDNPNTRFVGMSGTITDSSLGDYYHLLELAVGQLCFIPQDKNARNVWKAVLDVDGRPRNQDVNQFEVLCKMEGVPWPSGWNETDLKRKAARIAYRQRLRSTYGVLLTTKSSSDASLKIEVLEPDFGPKLRELIDEVKRTEILPNGEPIADGIEMARHMNTLAIGFFNRWDWDAVDADSVWNNRRKAWMKGVRGYLRDHSRPGCDSPALVERWVRGESPKNLLTKMLSEWDEVRDKNAPPTIPVWVSNEVVLWARDWVLGQQEPSVLWYSSIAVGERLRAMGLQVKLQKPKPDPRRMPRVALPMRVFHKGHNMQGYRKCLVLEPWSSGKGTEQLLGRNHRSGQESTCWWGLLGWTPSQRRRILRSVERAEYIQDTTEQAQKLLMGTWINESREVEEIVTRSLDVNEG